MSKKNKLTDIEKFRLFLEKERYTENINHYGINELIRYVEIEMLLPLKAELYKRQTVMDNLRNALDNYINPLQS